MKISQTIGIDGMHCAACSARTEKALGQIPGVSKAHVNLALEEAGLEYDDKKVSLELIEKTISALGFSVRKELTITEDDQIASMHAARTKMLIVWSFTIVITIFMIAHMLFDKVILGGQIDNWLMFALSILAMIFPARNVYISAFKSVRSGSANMDVLIAIGTLASLLTLPLSLVFPSIPGHAFSGIAAMILAFHLSGRYLESRARGKASEAIRKLMNLGAKTALMIVNGAETEVPIHKIQIGDILIVKPGMKVPTDGIVVEGVTTIDESMATGESMPVTRKTGDHVLGATLSIDGMIHIKAEKVGSDTFLAQVIRLVQEAQHSKVPIQVLADKITAVFVPIILVLATITFLAWYFLPLQMGAIASYFAGIMGFSIMTEGIASALMASIAVLVIACPCALGLATPTALMVGSGIGANRGILIRNGEALQTMKDIRVIVFDKTGTLTYGHPELVQIIGMEADQASLLSIAATLETGSEHPLAKAIIRKANQEGLRLDKVENFASEAGKGISGSIAGNVYHLGNQALMEQQQISLTDVNLAQNLYSYATPVYLADTTKVLAIFMIADTIKTEAKAVVSALIDQGILPVMISGDNINTARAIAAQCGIETVLANVLPQDKAEEVRKLQASHGAVAMVGDGINDAPALKQADIGIAMGEGTDIAIEAADITIVRSDLRSLLTAINLSKQTFIKIRQNLFWAFFYNLIAIPLAILGLLHPVIAEIAMAGSSITVVTNANLLKRKKLL